MQSNFSINMPSHYDEMLAVLKDAGIVRVEWRIFYNNDESDLDSIVAAFSDGSHGPLPEEVVAARIPFELWDLADDERLGAEGWINGLFVLDVNERTVTRTAEVFYDFDRENDEAERIGRERWHGCLGWAGTGAFLLRMLSRKRRKGEEFDEEALEKEQEQIDSEDYFSVTPLEKPRWYSL
jgi:hypothetical protein